MELDDLRARIQAYRNEKKQEVASRRVDRFVVPLQAETDLHTQDESLLQPEGDSFASLSPSPMMFTSPSQTRNSPDIAKPAGMKNEHFERLKNIESKIQAMPVGSPTRQIESPSFAVSTPGAEPSPPMSSVERLRRELEAVKGQIEAMEQEVPSH